MNRLWDKVILPIMEIIEAKHIVEIGCYTGKNTNNILAYCSIGDARVSCIDPFPQFNIEELAKYYGDKITFYKELSLSALPLIKDYDVVLIDGDHNWYTVYNELKVIEKYNPVNFPVVLIHDVGWPYGRRDMYYNPENIPAAYCQPYKKSGIIPGQSSLGDNLGLNSHLDNAIYENNPQNGVLTAIEDFLDETNLELNLEIFSGFHGLGVLFKKDKSFLDDFLKRINISSLLEEERLRLVIEHNNVGAIRKGLENSLENLQGDAIKLKEELEDVRFKYQEDIEELKQKYQEQMQAIMKELNTNEDARRQLLECNTDLKNNLDKTKVALRESQAEVKVHLNSVRYRLGDMLVSALKPSKHTILAPFKIVGLLLEGLLKVRARKSNRAPSKVQATESNSSILTSERESSSISIRTWERAKREQILNAMQEGRVSIIIPIFNAFEETKQCIESVFAYTTLPFQLILIDDCSTDKRIVELINSYQKYPFVNVIRNKENLGYVESVNIGISVCNNDVVLLNSDTIVTERWIQKLIISAYSSEKVGTVTPFSNAAGAFSVPKIGQENVIPPYLSVDSMGKIVERVSEHLYPEVPTGNGFCMYIKRTTIEDIGLFDGVRFRRGYGEENDFCMRARSKGWINIVDDSTFIYHKRSASFSKEKDELIKQNRAILDHLHPSYSRLVREFVKSKVFENIRDRLRDAIDNPSEADKRNKKRILYVLHEGSGGTPNTNKDLMKNIDATHECFVLTSNSKIVKLWEFRNQQSVEIRRWNLRQTWQPLNFTDEEFEGIYFSVLVSLGISIVHIRHLLAHSFDLPRIAKTLRIPVVLSFHDFYYICPSIHLLDHRNNYCEGQCTGSSEKCRVPSQWLHPINNPRDIIDVWRNKVREMFENCNVFVTTSETSKKVYEKNFPDLKLRDFRIIEHGRDFSQVEDSQYFEIPTPGRPIKILITGNIDNHKGSDFIFQLKKIDKNDRLQFHFLGGVCSRLKGCGITHGTYTRDSFYNEILKIRPSFIGIFSIWPETYCHTLSEAWACGIPVLASDIGTIRERMLKNSGGWRLDFNDPKGAYQKILSIAENREEYLDTQAKIKDIWMPSTKDMSYQYEKIYSDIVVNQNLDHSERKAPVRLGILTPKGPGGYPASSYIRVILPLSHHSLRGQVLTAVIDVEQAFSKGIKRYLQHLSFDTILVQRDVLGLDEARELVGACTDLGIRIVYELDDDLFNINETHTEFLRYKEKQSAMEVIATAADIITVSTDVLAQKMSVFNSNVKVIPNALDETVWFPNHKKHKFEEVSDSKNIVKLVYIGSYTHEKDLMLIKEPLSRAKEKLRGYGIELKFYVIGGYKEDEDWFIRIPVPKGKSMYTEFIGWLQEIADWDIAVAPLADNDLNRSKSPLKVLEYGALSLPCICSGIGPYLQIIQHNANGFLVGDNNDKMWEELIVQISLDKETREAVRNTILEEITERYLLTSITQRWRDCLLGYGGK